jgi:hypothetical protein
MAYSLELLKKPTTISQDNQSLNGNSKPEPGVSHPSPEDGNRSSIRNIVFSRIPDNGQSPKTH